MTKASRKIRRRTQKPVFFPNQVIDFSFHYKANEKDGVSMGFSSRDGNKKWLPVIVEMYKNTKAFYKRTATGYPPKEELISELLSSHKVFFATNTAPVGSQYYDEFEKNRTRALVSIIDSLYCLVDMGVVINDRWNGFCFHTVRSTNPLTIVISDDI